MPRRKEVHSAVLLFVTLLNSDQFWWFFINMPSKILIKLSLKVVPHPICVTMRNIGILLTYSCSVDISWLYTHIRLTALFLGLPGRAGTRKRAVKRMCVYLFPLLKSVSWEWFVDSCIGGLFVCLVLVLPEPVRSQSAGDVPRHVNRCGCHSDWVRRQECSHLGPRLRQLPQVHPCTRRPVRLFDCSIYIHTTATHV